jgi:hypothetical protein
MSCENVQKRISLLLDGKTPAGEQENVLAHTRECRECGTRLEALENQRTMMRRMPQAQIPDALAAKLRVMASHERERRLARISVRERLRRIASTVDLAFDNIMRPVALPFTGGIVSTILIFGLLMPTLSFSHQTGGTEFATYPSGRIVTNPYDQVADPDADFPRIEPINTVSDYLNVVDLTIDENGKVVDWQVVRGELTLDMKSVILFSNFEPATNMGIATSGKVRMVQFAPSMTVRG